MPVAAVEEETRAKVSFNSFVYMLGPATQPFNIKAIPVAAVEEETRAKVSLKGLSREIDLTFGEGAARVHAGPGHPAL